MNLHASIATAKGAKSASRGASSQHLSLGRGRRKTPRFVIDWTQVAIAAIVGGVVSGIPWYIRRTSEAARGSGLTETHDRPRSMTASAHRKQLAAIVGRPVQPR